MRRKRSHDCRQRRRGGRAKRRPVECVGPTRPTVHRALLYLVLPQYVRFRFRFRFPSSSHPADALATAPSSAGHGLWPDADAGLHTTHATATGSHEPRACHVGCCSGPAARIYLAGRTIAMAYTSLDHPPFTVHHRLLGLTAWLGARMFR